MYELMPSLKGMRVASTYSHEVPAGHKFAGRWHAMIDFCSPKSTEEAKAALRADLAGKGFKEDVDNCGDTFLSSNHPPQGYHYVSVKVYEERNVVGKDDPRQPGEVACISVVLSYYP